MSHTLLVLACQPWCRPLPWPLSRLVCQQLSEHTVLQACHAGCRLMPQPLSGSVYKIVGQKTAKRVKNFLGFSFCLHVTQCFDYSLKHHNAIVWPSVAACTSSSKSASVSTCALMYTSASLLPRNTASASKSLLANVSSSASACTSSNVTPSVLSVTLSASFVFLLLYRVSKQVRRVS